MLASLALLLTAAAGSLAAPASTAVEIRDEGDFVLVARADTPDYTQKYTTTGTVDFEETTDSYSVTFSGAADFVVGRGWTTGTERNITYSGSTSATAGTVLLAVYGWSTDPLIEYYIQEYSNTAGAASGTKVGSVVSDGSTYDIYKHQQVDQPSIVASSSTFYQYISVRTSERTTCGTVTVANHFAAWEALGLSLGTLNYQVLATEAWGSAAGSSAYTVYSSA